MCNRQLNHNDCVINYEAILIDVQSLSLLGLLARVFSVVSLSLIVFFLISMVTVICCRKNANLFLFKHFWSIQMSLDVIVNRYSQVNGNDNSNNNINIKKTNLKATMQTFSEKKFKIISIVCCRCGAQNTFETRELNRTVCVSIETYALTECLLVDWHCGEHSL